ncbi:response regulator [Pseudobacteriovorax antillogorgiicola]|uniref:CheY chemotaxis protein or a CheY-like REC (Receiver) domain n=1 Tax=Pseudobacteriovorax antillogorgiicola TaxID=1513793 RepID=A0A1Y6BEW1_9BACT|nr:response regulator [Pseudobacteriovorax antillogorgiicola]TCS56273.1 CheY-like chemotaxis protein [Pseudobacteriovorax antillogorgiicola]SMF07750.1 CheY chemotaxis protein or a CheY-like REC (receiver) domain [Pseudobacteriovorax antillogorgiicola]
MKFKDTKIKIVTVSSSPSKRQLVNTHLRSKGYEEVSGAPDLKTVVELLENESIHWLICPLALGEPINALQILQYITEHPRAMDMRMTLLIGDDELKYVGKAFDLGLLSYHVGLEAKTDVEAAFDEFMNLLESYNGRQDLLAAHYLRQYLKLEQRLEDLFTFEKKLLKLNPGQAELLMSVGEAHFLRGENERGENLCRQALLINPELEGRVQQYANDYGFDLEKPADDDQVWNILGVESCLVLDPQDEDRRQIVDFLKHMGVPDIVQDSSPQKAIDLLKQGKRFDLIIFEWSFPEVAGPILVQRLRDILGFSIPLTVINKDLHERDMPILREMGVTDRIGKPLDQSSFCKDVIWIINQDRQPTEPAMIYQKLMHAIKDRDEENVASLKQKYYSHPSVKDEEKFFIDGMIAFHSGLYLAAKESALKSLKAGGHSLDVLNLLGKSMMKLREFEAALRCLENAQMISPKNIERICQIAEAHLEAGREDEFEANLDRAQDLDEEHTAIKSAQAKAALKKGDHVTSKSLMSSLNSLEDIVSYTNNRAVSLIRTSSFDEGIRLYRDAIRSVPEDREKIRGIIAYNLALAHIRAGKLEEALKAVEGVSLSDKNSIIIRKVGNIRARLKKSIKTGEEFKLKPVQEPDLNEEQDKLDELSRQSEELFKNLKVKPGDIGCHKIYVERAVDEDIEKMLAEKIAFRRKASKAAKKAS